jgi:hypothetical protein
VCVFSRAYADTGEVYAWGYNVAGQVIVGMLRCVTRAGVCDTWRQIARASVLRSRRACRACRWRAVSRAATCTQQRCRVSGHTTCVCVCVYVHMTSMQCS